MKRICSFTLALLLLVLACLPALSEEAVTGIALSQKKATLLAGRAPLTLTATVTPASATTPLVWTSSKPTVAAVADGVVTPLSPGKAVITCRAETGKAKATCVVTVKPVKVESVVAAQTALSLAVGESETLTVTVAPDDATDKTPRFVSSNKKIATVDRNGVVTGVKAGKCQVTVSVRGFAKKLKIPVTVGNGGGGTKLTASISGVTSRRISFGRTANGVIKTVDIDFVVQSANGGTASLGILASQTSFLHTQFYKYDFNVSEEITLNPGVNNLTQTFYAAPWTYMGSDTPLLIRLTLTGKNGAQTPLTYRFPLYAVKLTEW